MIGHVVWANNRKPIPRVDACWTIRMACAIGTIYVDAVRESWRKQLAEADMAADWLILYALRDTWTRTHVPHPPIAGSI